MTGRIRESGHGGYIAEIGNEIKSGIEAGFKPGYFMPGFIVYKSARFDTLKQAKAFIAKNC